MGHFSLTLFSCVCKLYEHSSPCFSVNPPSRHISTTCWFPIMFPSCFIPSYLIPSNYIYILYIYIYRYPLWRNPGLVMLSVYILPDLCVSLGSIRDGERWRTFVSNVSMRTWRTQIALSPRGEVEFNGYHVLLFFFRKSDLAIEAPVIYMRKRCCFKRKERGTEEETSSPSKSDSLAGGSTPLRCYATPQRQKMGRGVLEMFITKTHGFQ